MSKSTLCCSALACVMWSRIVVARAESDLVRHVWFFAVIDNMVVLDSYNHEARASRRHKFRPTRSYGRLGTHRAFEDARMSEDDVPTPKDVFDEALDKARAQLKVGLWKRDFKR